MSETIQPGTVTSQFIPLDSIADDTANIRLTRPTDIEDALFTRSVEALGLIEPIVVREMQPGRYTLIAGARRVRAARKLGWSTISAVVHTGIDDIAAHALQAAENAHRAQMHPLDVWRAMVTLQEGGMSLTLAGQCLGITDAQARKLDRLGRIATPLIEAMHIVGVPHMRELAQIAAADAADQARVFKKHVKGKLKPDDHVSWWQIARDLTTNVIPMAHAIFDTAKVKGITWQEDVFAEPGGKAVFTTTDSKAFMKAQTAALREKTAKRIKRGEKVELVETDAGGADNAIPDGYQICHDPVPKSMKLPESDPRLLLVYVQPDGQAGEQLVIAKGRRSPKPKAPRTAKASPAAKGDGTEAAEPARTITNAGLTMLAAAKTRAIRQRLLDDQDAMQLATLLRLLCVAACAGNVKIAQEPGGYSSADMRDILARLVTPEGRLDLAGSMAELKAIAADIVSRIVLIAHPHGGSGAAGEIIGDAIAAADVIEPLDSDAFLKTLSAAGLRDAAAAADITGVKTAGALRERLAGKIGTRWRPPEAEFHPVPLSANPPAQREEDDDDSPEIDGTLQEDEAA